MALTKQQIDDQIAALNNDGSISQDDVNYLINYLIANGDLTGTPRDLIQIRRGNKADLPNLAQGELGFTFDTQELFIGGTNGNVKVNKKSDRFVNVKEFGATGDGVTDDTLAIKNALEECENLGGAYLYFPTGSYRVTSPLTLKQGTTLIGDGISNTSLLKDYVESTPSNGFIIMDSTNNCGGLQHIQLYSKQNGGSGISLIATATDAPDFIVIEHVYVTGSAMWNYCIYVDGDLRTNAPQGVRDLKISFCDLFQADTSVVFLKAYNNVTISNTALYSTGTNPSDKLVVQGGTNFASNFLHADLLYGLTIDIGLVGSAVNQTYIKTPLINNFNTGQMVFNCVVVGRVTNKNVQWKSGTIIDPNGSLFTGGIENQDGGRFGSTKRTPNGLGTIGHIGHHGSMTVENGQSFTFATLSSKLFSIYRAGGQAALVHGDYASSTLTLLSNPSNMFENSSSPTAGKIGIFKNVNSHDITVVNNMGASDNINVMVIGSEITSVTNPA